MADLGRNGIRRGKGVRTTVPAKDGDRAGGPAQPAVPAAGAQPGLGGRLHLRAAPGPGSAYVAFIVDVFAQSIVAWHAATDKRTDLVLTPLRIALWDRDRTATPCSPGS